MPLFTALRPTRDASGQVIPRLWDAEGIRLERDERGWYAEVLLREIGSTGYFEFSATDRGGAWRGIGHYRTRRLACLTADRLQSGVYVWRAAYSSGDGRVPGQLYEWATVAHEISTHPSVRGDT